MERDVMMPVTVVNVQGKDGGKNWILHNKSLCPPLRILVRLV